MTKIQVNLDQPRYSDRREFEPDLSPCNMAKAGVFQGGYFHNAKPEDLVGIPQSIIDLQSRSDDAQRNLFKVKSGLSHAAWAKNGWLRDQDPMGWYQWYIRFHEGRRSDDDERQIKRWINYRSRWTPKDEQSRARQAISPKGRQALLSWALDPYRPEHARQSRARLNAGAS